VSTLAPSVTYSEAACSAAGGVPYRLLVRLSLAAKMLAVGLGLALAVVVALPPLFGMHSLVVTGASMAPTIPRGSMILVRPVAPGTLHVGDVVTFSPADQPGVLVTHRVVRLELDDAGVALRTRGDNNDADDVWTVRGDEMAGKVVASAPVVGYVVAAAGLPAARVALLVLIVGVLVLTTIRRPQKGTAT
jgi:signal peptidase